MSFNDYTLSLFGSDLNASPLDHAFHSILAVIMLRGDYFQI